MPEPLAAVVQQLRKWVDAMPDLTDKDSDRKRELNELVKELEKLVSEGRT